jgi:hypothetical protein
MAYLFIASQLLTSLTVRFLFHRRGYHWALRHTLLCSIAPIVLFVLWTIVWWFLPADILPATWLDERPTTGERVFMCLPPLVFSWLLFFALRGRLRAHETVA